MTGRIIFKPGPSPHRCDPPTSGADVDAPYDPESGDIAPVGTVWRCDTCGKTWVVHGDVWPYWKPESRLARWHPRRPVR